MTTAAVAFAGVASAAQAQQTAAGPPTASTPPTQLGEVIVTAQKRTENLQKAPLAITAVGAQQLHDEHITGPNDLTNVIPDMLVNSGGSSGDNGSAKTVFSIRGLGASGTNPEGSPGVAVHLDGHYFQSGIAANEFFDLERIEVAPGPQGTLYGRSAAAGAVNIITNKPVDAFHAAAELEGGNYGEFRGFGMINLPVTDTLAIRLSGQYWRHDGYLSNGFDDLDTGTARAQALWKPTSKLSVRVVAQYLQNGGLGTSPAQVGATVTALGLGSNPYDHSVAQYTYIDGVKVPSNDRIHNTKTDFFGELTYNFGPTILTILPTFERFINDFYNAPLAGPYFAYTSTGPETQTSVEARLNDPGTTRLKWVAGLNYFNDDLSEQIEEHVVPDALVPSHIGPFTGVQVADAFDSIRPTNRHSYALFGQFTYPILDHLRLTGGVRQNWDYASLNGQLGTTSLTIGQSPNLVPPGGLIAPPFTTAVNFSKITWKAALDYDLTPRSLIYVTVGTGYKPGGVNETAPPSSNTPPSPVAPNTTYQPETVMHYEVGSKNRFFDNRLQINGAAYYDDYSNYQNANAEVASPLIFQTLGTIETNAGGSKVYGTELSAELQATPADHLSVSVNYLRAYFTSYIVASYLAPGGVVIPQKSYAGYDLPNAPNWSGNVSYSHRFDLPGGASLTGLAATYLTTGYWSYYQEESGTRQGSYTKTTLNLTYQNAAHDFSVSAFVKNLEDNATIIQGNYTAPFALVFYDAPRTYGITVSKRF